MIQQVVLEGELLTGDQVRAAAEKAREQHVRLEQYVADNKLVTEGLLYEAIAAYYHLPYVDLRNQTIRRDILQLLPESMVQVHQILPFEQTPSEIKVANTNPNDLLAIEFVRRKLGPATKFYLTSPASAKTVLQQYHKGLKAEFKEISKVNEVQEITGGKKLQELAQDVPVIRIVDTLLEYAIYEGASDIHIEPTEGDTVVRYRIDGILRDVMTLPRSTQAGVVARIKILSSLKLDEHRLPQDGRFKIATDQYKVSIRVSIIPVYDGEKLVLRILNETAQTLNLEQIGLLPSPLDIVRRNIQKPHGMILSTGPTGSGKTTTLYTILGMLNKPGVNISTIEDPIEYRMPRVNQSQVNPKIGFSFANGLRSLLRQDPDIIMVGEIRDEETAEIAVHSAMTGHLVLSTLHTNDAVTTLPRLSQMGVPSYLVATTTNIVIAQRLVRKICQHCITSYTLTAKNLEELQKQIDVPTLLNALERHGAINTRKQTPGSLLFFRGRGCKQCNDTGYRGRIGIYEVLEMTQEIKDAMVANMPSHQLFTLATKQGMITLIEDGFLKAKNGITTIEEVLRVTKE
ncbi:MAG: type II/IV secretion system protein [Candidatus Kerfeldbacteria bacterium]|nr:type II/IV secretion system protein [Candidatus Kerfeldbacteria bacterium]